MDDEGMLRLLHEDGEGAMEILMDEYMGLVYTIVSNTLFGLTSREDVEECVSDVFLLFYRQRYRVDLTKGSIKAYLSLIAKRKAIDRFRAARTKPGHYPLDESLLSAAFPGDSPEADYVKHEEHIALIRAIHSLGKRDAEIILRKYYLREPSKSIARRLAMTVTAVDTRASRAVAKLKAMKGSAINE